MNNVRRKKLKTIYDKLGVLNKELNSLLEEEQAIFDNIPKAFREAPQYEGIEDVIEALEAAGSDMEDLMDHIQESVEA